MTVRKKLIEVALPLEAINAESAREKSIRHGHPSTLHLWWARRPLAACRAVLWASLVDDPSSWPDRFPTEAAQQQERQRLFDILGRFVSETDKKGKTKQVVRGLVSWKDINDPNCTVLVEAQLEIARSLAWNRGEEPPAEAAEVRAYIARYAPPAYDPFCGGGSIPLEAQRLGLEAHGSDLNPVAVLITKALIEIPPKFKDSPPVNPASQQKLKTGQQWYSAQGLAEDVRYYGQWMREEAFKRIGHLYPKVELPPEHGGGEATVIAWLWARTVTCPNPACGCQMPLVRSFQLSSKKGKEAWVEPEIDRSQTPPTIQFAIKTGQGKSSEGTVSRKGAQCTACKQPVSLDYVRSEGKAGRIGERLMAIVAEGNRQRIYLSPNKDHQEVASQAEPSWKPEMALVPNSRHITPYIYGITKHSDLFTSRQLTALVTFSNLVNEVRENIYSSAIALEQSANIDTQKNVKGNATEYANAVATYLAFAVDRSADFWCSISTWSPQPKNELVAHAFTRQAISMTWDFAEANPFSNSGGNFEGNLAFVIKALNTNISHPLSGTATQIDARDLFKQENSPLIVSTDPPYYDAVPYADLSDFFYVWLRRSLSKIYPDIFSTLLVPKNQELVADQLRHGSREKSQIFFEEGLEKVFCGGRQVADPNYPFTVYYAFKQSESVDRDNSSKGSKGLASTGWETMLEGLVRSGFAITGTWPVRTERSARMRSIGSNALASSIVLVCRPRPAEAARATRRQFINELKRALPKALKTLQQGNIAPVDLAQASIGPGMAVFSKYAAVLEADGSPMRVRTALQLINQILDEYLAEQEGEFDADTRWALTWFEQYQFNAGQYGDAETLSKAKNTSIQGLMAAGILDARGGKVRLLRREELAPDWTPAEDNRVPDWEATQHLCRALQTQGEMAAAALLAQVGERGEAVRDLAYRLYSLCDRKGWAAEGVAYNSLVISWNEIARLANEIARLAAKQQLSPRQGDLGLAQSLFRGAN